MLAFWVSLSSADPDLFPARGETITVHVLDHGYHSGLIVPKQALYRAAEVIALDDASMGQRLRTLAGLFSDADWLEIGWGDAEFYRSTPTVSDVNLALGVRALFWPTDTVLQVVPGNGQATKAFPRSGILRLGLSPEGFVRLARRLAETIPEPFPDAAGRSLYGAGAFFPATLRYHLFRTCNHWTAWLLRGAGVPASAVPGTLSTTLMLELRLRVSDGVN